MSSTLESYLAEVRARQERDLRGRVQADPMAEWSAAPSWEASLYDLGRLLRICEAQATALEAIREHQGMLVDTGNSDLRIAGIDGRQLSTTWLIANKAIERAERIAASGGEG